MFVKNNMDVYSVLPDVKDTFNPLGPTKDGKPAYMHLKAGMRVEKTKYQPIPGTVFFVILEDGRYKNQMFRQTEKDAQELIGD